VHRFVGSLALLVHQFDRQLVHQWTTIECDRLMDASIDKLPVDDGRFFSDSKIAKYRLRQSGMNLV